MRTRTSLLVLIVVTTLLGALGSFVAVGASAGTAHACSIQGPMLQVNPANNLRPGQQIEVTGTGFFDLIPHEPPPPGEPRALCDFDLVPIQEQKVIWNGSTSEGLTVVAGPRFQVTVQVPLSAEPGPAAISFGSQTAPVSVMHPEILPPDPQPEPWPEPKPEPQTQPEPQPQPEPWPCPFLDTTLPGRVSDTEIAPGFLPPCPEPCVDYLHTTSDGTTYDYKWDCPDPCGYPHAGPGAATESTAVWCPPPPPEPCGVPVPQPVRGYPCPEPCQLVGGDAWSCPEPCGVPVPQPGFPYPCPIPCSYLVEGDLNCPEPCPVYLQDARGLTLPDVAPPCPDPCGPDAHVDVVWCPPTKEPAKPVVVGPPVEAVEVVEAVEPAPAVSVSVAVVDAEEAFVEEALVEEALVEEVRVEPAGDVQPVIVEAESVSEPVLVPEPVYVPEPVFTTETQEAAVVVVEAEVIEPDTDTTHVERATKRVTRSALAVFAMLFG